jgi:iron complex transport system ATP-binding protein
MSQGEQQRVLIARGIVHRPKLLILDEPCAGLDPAVRESFLADLSRIVKRRGAPTVVFVTHHIEEIGPWITSGLVLRGGEVLASGPIASVLTGEVLGKAFGRRCRVEIEDGRRWLRLDRGR